MGFVYKYLRKRDFAPVYVGIVHGDDKTALDRRIAQHRSDKWYTKETHTRNGGFEIHYISVESRTDLEYIEASLISELGTGGSANIAKTGWGTSAFISDGCLPWLKYDINSELVTIPNIPAGKWSVEHKICRLCGEKLPTRIYGPPGSLDSIGVGLTTFNICLLHYPTPLGYGKMGPDFKAIHPLCMKCCDDIKSVFSLCQEYADSDETPDKRRLLLRRIIDSCVDSLENVICEGRENQ